MWRTMILPGLARLASGDSVSFADFEPHPLRNDGSVDAVAIVCVIGDHEGSPPSADHRPLVVDRG